jgi:hypothetical protein
MRWRWCGWTGAAFAGCWAGTCLCAAPAAQRLVRLHPQVGCAGQVHEHAQRRQRDHHAHDTTHNDHLHSPKSVRRESHQRNYANVNTRPIRTTRRDCTTPARGWRQSRRRLGEIATSWRNGCGSSTPDRGGSTPSSSGIDSGAPCYAAIPLVAVLRKTYRDEVNRVSAAPALPSPPTFRILGIQPEMTGDVDHHGVFTVEQVADASARRRVSRRG